MNVTGINKNNKEWMIAIIITYLFILLCLATYAIGAMSLGWLPAPYAPLRVPLMCGAIAYIGGCLYCFRAIYINKCIRKQWDPDWHVWYFIRPLTSTIAGAISYLFLKEGANKQVISSQADSLIKISRIWADFFPANTSNQPI
ncbi:hypothetical protein [Enterobacter hormaechei]|uniref:hypothetical protein n=1 Tax=Enterobacter hormaechei TaxID=158836 RepID=UPI003524BA64